MKLMCKLPKWLGGGHKRGKRTGVSSELGIQYRCNRCGSCWNRKTAKKAVK